MIKERNNVTQTTRDILVAVSERHTNDFFITECKNGPTQLVTEFLQIDAVAIKKSWAHPCVAAYEVKSSRSDFIADTKWPGYKAYCNQLSFACPEGIIKPEELPEEIGLYYYRSGKKLLKAVRKPLFRDVEIPSEFFLYIIFNHLDSDRIPFHSSTKAFFEDWLETKQANGLFGLKVSEAFQARLLEMNSVKREIESNQRDLEVYRAMIDVMLKHGLGSWKPAERLEEALLMKCNPRAEQVMDNIESNLKTLKKYIGLER